MKRLMPLMLALLLASCTYNRPSEAPRKQVGPRVSPTTRPTFTPAAVPARASTQPALRELKLDIAVASKAKPAPAGWTEWILPADAATATKDFRFPGGRGPGGADTVRVTISTGAGNNWNGQYGIEKAPGNQFEAVISDHAVTEGTGEEGTCAVKLAVEGLPAGSSVKGMLFSSVSKEGYDAFYGENGSFDASLGVIANGASVAAEQSYITEPVDAKKAGIPFGFTATGKDNLVIANTKSNWLIVPVDGITLTIGQ